MPKKILKGQIVSDKMQKTVVVSVETTKRHPFYSKNVTTHKRYKARNETEAKLGDTVLIEEHKPFSKEVRWLVTQVLEEDK